MANTAKANDLDQELFSKLVEPLVQPLLIHMVALFVNGDDKNFSLQINGKILWKKLEGNLKKPAVCGPPSKLTFHWIHTGGISLRSRRQNERITARAVTVTSHYTN